MAANDFSNIYAYSTTAQVVPQSDWISYPSIANGQLNGSIADNYAANKIWRQTSTWSAILGQFTADISTLDVLDAGDIGSNLPLYHLALLSCDYVEDTSTTPNVITASTPTGLYTIAEGMKIRIKVKNTNTGNTTINVNGMGVNAILTDSGSALVGGELIAGKIYSFSFSKTAGYKWIIGLHDNQFLPITGGSITGRLALGTSISPYAGVYSNWSDTDSSGTNISGITSSLTSTATSGAGNKIGVVGGSTVASGYAGTGQVAGVFGYATQASSASAYLLSGGAFVVSTAGSGTIANSQVATISYGFNNSTTVTNSVGLQVNAMTCPTGGTPTTSASQIYIGDITNASNSFGLYSNVSSGTNKYNIYVAGTATSYFAGGITSNTIATSAPVTTAASTYSIGSTTTTVIFNTTATHTLTLPAASSYSGRIIYLKNIAAFAINSATSNVVPLTSATAGTSILAATAGKWCKLQSDGSNWIIIAAN